MPDTLYEQDMLAWTEQQGDLLRRLVAGERVNEAVDWPNLIEEVEALGRSEFQGFESLLRQAILHLLKLHAWPGSRSAGHWRAETLGFLDDAQGRFSPSMRQRTNLDAQYAKALRRVQAVSDESGDPRPFPDACPLTLDDLLAADPDLDDLVQKLTIREPAHPGQT